MKNYAAIDVGSNSVLLLIAEVRGRAISRTLLGVKESPRISTGLAKSGLIDDNAVTRLIATMKRLSSLCEKYSVQTISCYGTSALRRAGNSREVISRVKNGTGISIKVISGRKEAALTYLGAVTGMTGLKRSRVLIDAGGGSSEVVVADGSRILSAKSFKIGAVTLTERCKTNRKLNSGDLESTLEKIRAEVSKLRIPSASTPMSLVLSGGTATSIQAYRVGLKSYEPDRIHGASMRVAEYRNLVNELARMKLHSRRKALVFEPKRAEVITAGGLLTITLAEQYTAEFVTISDRSLRHGQLFELLGRSIEFA
jgi:exopolyphosphatase/guanosine-5'-triphosphate,3'-diphosphate pyrophosphatase